VNIPTQPTTQHDSILGALPTMWYGTTAPNASAVPWSAAVIGSVYFTNDGNYTKTADGWVPDIAGQIQNVKTFGARGDATGDDSPAFQAAIDASVTGGVVYIPRGYYRINSTLQVSTPGIRFVGAAADRYNGSTTYGSQLLYYGEGSFIQIGTDDGLAWNAANYNGVAGTTFEHLALKHNAPATALANGQANYKAGSYGIRDWRGGSIFMRNVLIENFEYNFWGVQSDINQFHSVTSTYSKYGFYIGPRSDQNSLYDFYPVLCDTGLTLDQPTQTRIVNPQIVGCGSASTYPVDIKAGTVGVIFNNPWFEMFQGYNGEVIAPVAAGINAGYDGATTLVDDLAILHPQVSTATQGTTRHFKYLVAGDNCNVVVEQVHGNPTNLSKIFASMGASAGSYYIRQVGSAVNSGNLIDKVGAGTPLPYADLWTLGNHTIITQSTRIVNQLTPLNANSAEQTFRLDGTTTNRSLAITWPNSTAGGNLTRLQWNTRINPGTAAPTTNTWAVGDFIQNTAPAELGSAASKYVVTGWICTVAGTPGTWLECRSLTGN
jgi:Pectate lyase superfamily protein